MEPHVDPMPRGGLAGRTVGGIVLESLLGVGGMAEVYRGVELALGREVAVKVLPPPLAQVPLFLARFRAEARAVAALDSPHIVPIYQFGEDNGLLYLVMPILADSLRSKLQREGIPPVETAVLLVTQVAEALETAHAAGIVHRDVKPENILLDAQDRPLLSDFGIARDLTGLQAAGTSGALATTGPLLGTPQYMAPEQLRQQPADQRSDVYALGVVLYELLTGRLPHEAASPFEVAASVLTQPVVPPSRHNPSIGPALEVVVLTALASDPAARFPTARDFARSLRQALEEEHQAHGLAPLHSSPSLALALAQPQSSIARMASATSASLAALATATTRPLRHAVPTRRVRRQRWGRMLALAALAAALVVVLTLTGTLIFSNGAPAPGAVLLPLPGLAASQSSPTAPGSGALDTTATPGITPSTTAGMTPSPAPTGSPSPGPSPSATPTPTPSLAISPTDWQLAFDPSSGLCTSVLAYSQKITNNGGSSVSWQWQSTAPGLPSDFQYRLTGGLNGGWKGGLPNDLLLGAGATHWLDVQLACGESYTITLAAHGSLGGPTSTYTITLHTPDT